MRGTSFRYQTRELLSDEKGIATYSGIDPLTGLPVLIYTFAGKPPTNLHELESEAIPGILDSKFDGQTSQVAVVYARGYLPVAEIPAAERILVLDSAKALRDAARAGVIHGDIRPERLLSASDHVLLEGFGATRPNDQKKDPFVKDIQDWARSILIVLGDKASPGLKEILQTCVDDVSACSSAPELFQRLETYYRELADRPLVPQNNQTEPSAQAESLASDGHNLADELSDEPIKEDVISDASWQGSNGFDDLELDFELKPELSSDVDDIQAGDFAPPKSDSEVTAFQSLDSEDVASSRVPEVTDAAAATIPSWSDGLQAQSRDGAKGETAKNLKDSFVRELPPGATYRAGTTPETGRSAKLTEDLFFEDEFESAPRRNMRSILLVAVLLLAAAALALWAFSRQDRPAGSFGLAPENQTARSFIVDVSVEPTNLPPVEVVVVSSPTGSKYQPGSFFRLPGRGQIVLDHDGTWQLQASFQERVSDIVTFTLPQDRSIVISLPEEAVPEGD